MASDQTLVRFNLKSSKDFFKCLKLAEKIEREKQETKSTTISKARIRNFKRCLDISDFDDFENLTLGQAENFAREQGYRLRIWKQKTYRHKLFLEFEANVDQNEADTFKDLDLFRTGL